MHFDIKVSKRDIFLMTTLLRRGSVNSLVCLRCQCPCQENCVLPNISFKFLKFSAVCLSKRTQSSKNINPTTL